MIGPEPVNALTTLVDRSGFQMSGAATVRKLGSTAEESH